MFNAQNFIDILHVSSRSIFFCGISQVWKVEISYFKKIVSNFHIIHHNMLCIKHYVLFFSIPKNPLAKFTLCNVIQNRKLICTCKRDALVTLLASTQGDKHRNSLLVKCLNSNSNDKKRVKVQQLMPLNSLNTIFTL